jgi:GDP-L-galactose phosphorylase
VQVVQPFDDGKFNFTKALQKEVLFQFEAADMPSKGAGFLPLAPVCGSPNLVFINVSPIEYGHVLLVPRILDKLNQLVDPSTLELALQFAQEANNPYFRLAFNSLGAYGTVNHLHFQVFL